VVPAAELAPEPAGVAAAAPAAPTGWPVDAAWPAPDSGSEAPWGDATAQAEEAEGWVPVLPAD
jgi:hypothetical protein